ncbi:kinesin-related protein 4 isoform X2 [Bicyclus anynana]|uniref:Kinesin-related protein 4 isoform X2 n=1 Tax=Bicyclus anynana TaxID=110368 RepID=A0ABM3LGD2_BICAN|nr:kinesin-related protein 4 isoform X2 [Bicyclus anynana]
MSDNIKVVVKVRPLIRREIEDKLLLQWRVNNNALIQLDQNGRDCGPIFTFDKVYDESTKTDDVYNDIAKPIVKAATDGFNGTIFAYGQTSSGKTYTMTGTDDSPGIIPLAVVNLFDIIKSVPDRDFLVRVSYVEIYNERLIDLLDLNKTLKIHDTFNQGVKVDATERLATSPEEVLEVMKEGKANRQTGATNMNEESSRSHSIFQITIESREHIEGEEEVGSVNVSQLNLVDLAGSERSGQTGAKGLRFKEGTHINKSLSVLALVIKQLSEDPNKHANYRDSKLTRILQNSLGGNAKTSIICAVTPAAIEETISTLQFANRAKSIKNTPAVNAVATNATMIQSLTKQLSALKTQLESKKNVEKDNFKLQKKIGGLQKLILNGFGTSDPDVIGGARRKLKNPRRVTISTLHAIQEDAGPPAPRFCTPSLKYNPLSLNILPDFAPIHGSTILPTVAEERLVTPPPYNKKVTISDEIIELDSDSDSSIDAQTCSPIHQCHDSKTPPCILRKNAKLAERNLKDIVEFTEREKLYAPNVVELMEKLERKSLKISNLQDNINELSKISQEKDKEMEQLKKRISEAEIEIQNIASAKSSLETACENYSTKLTDWEVSYETLQKKAKSREEELLSLLKEHEAKKIHEKIGKISSKAIGKDLVHLMDMSRDISLVNSDNENSIINEESDVNSIIKNQSVLQLEANLHAQNIKINTLENINKKLQDMISDFKEKVTYLENQNKLNELTINNLNRTIESQKSVTEMAKADIESYNDSINKINESDIETMIANEELFIASNENMKNIIHSLKSALDLRNEEIKKLKSSLYEETIHNNKSLEKDIESKKTEISMLIKEIETLKEDNITEVNNFIVTKNNFLNVEQQLKTQLTEVQKLKDIEIDKLSNNVANLTRCKEDLTSELMKKQQDKENLEIKVDNLSQEILTLKKHNKTKDNIITEMKNEEKAAQENFARVSVQLQNLIRLLSGKILEVPEIIDSLVSAFGTLTENLTSLEIIALDIVKEKNDLRALVDNHQTIIMKLTSQIDDLNNTIDVFYKDGECLNNIIVSNHSETNNEDTHRDVKLNMDNLVNKIKVTLEYLNNNLQNKALELNNLKIEFESKLTSTNTNNLQQIHEITKNRNLVLTTVIEKVTALASQLDMETSLLSEFKNNIENVSCEQIALIFDYIADNILSLNSQYTMERDNIREILTDAKKEIHKLTEENSNLLLDISNLEKCNFDLSEEIKNIQNDGKVLSQNLNTSNTILTELRNDLISKTNEIEIIENKAKEWKEKFRENELTMINQIKTLELEKSELKTKCLELQMQSIPITQSNFVNRNQMNISKRLLTSPPSLLTICCDILSQQIIGYIQVENDNLESSSSTSTDLKYICQCTKLSADLTLLHAENSNLRSRIQELEIANNYLLKDQNEVQKEVQLLLENTQELQKKVVNHRTNLSTLTATTYAENKSLTSQIKFLQHLHNRFHNVCQKDLPAFKNQLQNLMILLKSENIHKQNESFKRYSLPNTLDITSKFKNESILDGDLLMLDTNITLTTCDNTLVGNDQTCLDVTQMYACSEVACQTSLLVNDITKHDLLHSQMEMQPFEYKKIYESLESLQYENSKLRDLVDEYALNKKSNVPTTDTISSPFKIQSEVVFNQNGIDVCYKCNHEEDIRTILENHRKEIDLKMRIIKELESQKQDIEQKYRDLALELPSTEVLVQKLSILEKESFTKQNEITTISQTLITKNNELKLLQEENDCLSNQVFESISELDDLKKDYDSLKEINSKLTENLLLLETKIADFNHTEKEITCTQCKLKNEVILNLENKLASESHIKLNRSYSDSDSSSRCNKICSLQNELHAGKEDCIELKEEVTTIKNHLDRSNLTIGHMDLDDNIENSHMYSYDDFESISPQDIKCNMPDITGEALATFTIDKEKCLVYYAEITGADKESIACDIKVIDIMKLLYDYIEIKHANEVENLTNKLKDFENSKHTLQITIDELKTKNSSIAKELQEKNIYLQTMANVVSHVRSNISDLSDGNEIDILIQFKDNFLKVIDREFGLSGTTVFENAVQQLHQNHATEMEKLRNDNTKLDDDIQEILKNTQTVNENYEILKTQLDEKEKEFNLLQKQKEKIQDINAAVTLDIVKREEDLRKQIEKGFLELVNRNIINVKMNFSLPTNKLIELLFEHAFNNTSNESLQKELTAEINKLKTMLIEKEKDLCNITRDCTAVNGLNYKMRLELSKKEEDLKVQISQVESLSTSNLKKDEVIVTNTKLINELREELTGLKATLMTKETVISSLETKLEDYNKKNLDENESKISQLLKCTSELRNEIEKLKYINEIVVKEKEKYSIELDKAGDVIKQNKIDLDKMTEDILVLKDTIKENSATTEKMRREFETLSQAKENLAVLINQLQEQIKEKSQNCSRLEMNIKTHEKTAEIQSRMIIRLQKQKEIDDKMSCEKDLKLEEVIRKCKSFETECEKLSNDLKSSTDEIVKLKSSNLLLETRVAELEEEVQIGKRRISLEATAETARRRRQSIHDSKRMIGDDSEDHSSLKSHPLTHDSLMDVDGGSSNRSTPAKTVQGRDSFIAKHDQEEELSRSGSVTAIRRRRQSVHDLHRSVQLAPDRVKSLNSKSS